MYCHILERNLAKTRSLKWRCQVSLLSLLAVEMAFAQPGLYIAQGRSLPLSDQLRTVDNLHGSPVYEMGLTFLYEQIPAIEDATGTPLIQNQKKYQRQARLPLRTDLYRLHGRSPI